MNLLGFISNEKATYIFFVKIIFYKYLTKIDKN